MTSASITRVSLLCGVLSMVVAAKSLSGEPSEDIAADASVTEEPNRRVSVETARERAKLMHHIYGATLDAMHHYYFHANKAVIPARAMEDVFADVARTSQSTARWISVNTKAMSIDHEPSSEFEKAAAAELATGKPEFERVEGGNYLRAAAIPLTAGCIGCHTGAFTKPSSTARYAGLVISIPVHEEK